MADIVVTEDMDSGAVEWLRARCDVHYDPTLGGHQEDIPALLGDARALIVRNRTWVSADFVSMVSHLDCIGRIGVLFDNIDTAACERAGIALYRADGANNRSVAEYVLAMAMVLMRGTYGATAQVAAGQWPRDVSVGREIAGKTLGVLGYGEIGRSVARLASLFGLNVIAADPFVDDSDPAWEAVQRVDEPTLFAQADIVSVHIPTSPRTRHLIGADAIGMMKEDAVLIAPTGGGNVDEFALAAAMRAGHLTGAALDVFETEPLSAVDGAKFADLPNVILTPRISGYTVESNARLSQLIAERVAAHLGIA